MLGMKFNPAKWWVGATVAQIADSRQRPQTAPDGCLLPLTYNICSETTCRLCLGRIKLLRNKRQMQAGATRARAALFLD